MRSNKKQKDNLMSFYICYKTSYSLDLSEKYRATGTHTTHYKVIERDRFDVLQDDGYITIPVVFQTNETAEEYKNALISTIKHGKNVKAEKELLKMTEENWCSETPYGKENL